MQNQQTKFVLPIYPGAFLASAKNSGQQNSPAGQPDHDDISTKFKIRVSDPGSEPQ